MFDLLSLRLLCQNGCFVAYLFFVFRSYSCFCYLLVVKNLWALHYVVQGEGFSIVLVHGFGASTFQIYVCVCVCVFFIFYFLKISRFVFFSGFVFLLFLFKTHLDLNSCDFWF